MTSKTDYDSEAQKPPAVPVEPENIPSELKALDRWICWSWSRRGTKWDKPPLRADGRGFAKSDDPATWSSFEDALEKHQTGKFDGIGFVLNAPGEAVYVGVDFDDCLDENQVVTGIANNGLQLLDSYCEMSPSGRGVKLICKGQLPPGKKADHERGVEMYATGRYFTVTGHQWAESPSQVTERGREVRAFHEMVFVPREKKKPSTVNYGESKERDIKIATEALEALGSPKANGYYDWLSVGMVLHDVDDSLLDVWDRWSERCCKEQYQRGACEYKWTTFHRGGGQALGSLIHWAREDGWDGPHYPVSSNGSPKKPSLEDAATHPWPEPINEIAYHGLLGEIVRAIEPHSEADPAAILIQMMVAFGNLIHRNPFFRAEADHHYMNLFVVIVGATSKGRKGASWGHVWNIFQSVDENWSGNRILSGLSSGEGLIWAVRDPISKKEPVKEGTGKDRRVTHYLDIEVDSGETDKRLLILESEFASVLRRIGREGNTLSAILRQAWETGSLRTLTKTSPATATGAHISIVGHVTSEELRRNLTATEAANGFGNRFLWLCVKRSKALPEGGRIQDVDLDPFIRRLSEAANFARNVGQIDRDDEARKVWARVYEKLSAGKPGLLGAMVSRAEAQVMRIACMYALLDKSRVIRKEHLQAALSVWDFVEKSVEHIFGGVLGDPVADAIMMALKGKKNGLTRTEISNLFGRHQDTSSITVALSTLHDKHLIKKQVHETNGRPTERWTPVQA